MLRLARIPADSRRLLTVRNLLSSVVALAVLTPAAPAVTLVEDGKPKAMLILPDSPSPAARQAARVLQDHLRQISGAVLPLRAESAVPGMPSPEQPWILVGEGERARKLGFNTATLGPGGVLLQAKGPVLALLGTDTRTPADPYGTLWAVTLFLENQLGVRYLWPGELGKVVPKRKTITVADFEHRFTPRLPQRHIRSLGYNDRLQAGLDRLGFTKADYDRFRAVASKTEAESSDWFRWHRLGGTLNLRSGHAFGHLWAKYGKEHPDWFALQPDGSRDQKLSPDRARLCKSNPDLIAAIAREKIEELNNNPDLLGVSLGPNDGGRATFCTCPKCEALDDPRARKVRLLDFTGGRRREFEHVALTDRMVSFWNAIAEQVARVHPKRLLVVDAYSAYATPPLRRELHPNLVVRFASLSYHSEKERQENLKDWDAWSRSAKRIFFRSNLMLAGRRDGLPLLYVHRFGRDFRHLAEHGMLGTDLDSCCHHWATQGLNYYVVARLHWDPEQNVDALIDDYCRSGFGPAAASVRRYFAQLEDWFDARARREESARPAFPPEMTRELRKLLARARREASEEPTVLARLDFLELGLRWTELESQALAFLVDPARADKAAAKKVLDERHALMRDLFQKSPFALEVAYIAYGEGGLWNPLGYRFPK
jgi:hypothetical protein